jgi:putative transposase
MISNMPKDKQKITKTALAVSLGISRQSLYYKPCRPAKDLLLKDQIKEVLKEHPSYGHKRIALELKMNKKKVLRVMKKFNLKPYKRRVKKPNKPNDLGKPPTIYQNEIKNICPIKPNIIWAADFTYIKFQNRFIYLATIMDLFTREIIGFSVSAKHDRFLVLEILDMALNKTKTNPGYHHSDQGSEYDSDDYIKKLKENGIIISMSKKGHPWENGYQEAFYSQFKVDLGRPDQFETLGELIEAIYLKINYYNTRRIHTSLKMSPIKFREQFDLKTLSLTNPRQRQFV